MADNLALPLLTIQLIVLHKENEPMSNQDTKATQQLVETLQTETASDTAYDSIAHPLWELVVEIGAQVPDEEWAKVPTDLSKNVAHYLYGAPKNDE